MNKSWFHSLWIAFLTVILVACGNSTVKEIPVAETEKKDSVPLNNIDILIQSSKYAELLEKFKPLSFDTLMVEYHSGTEDKRFSGRELILDEASCFPLDITNSHFGELSGVYACYRFPLDSIHIALIARIPGEYESSTMGLFIFDLKKDQVLKEYLHLSVNFGDAGEVYERISWLIKTKNKHYQSLIYDYNSYYHGVEDTTDETVDEWEWYCLLNCMSPKFDTISKNEIRLKKQFKNLLKKVE